MAFAPDGTAVTAQTDGLVRIWSAASGREQRAFDVTAATPAGHKTIQQFAVSRDGRFIAAAGFVREAAAQRAVDKIWILSLPEARVLRTIDTKTRNLQCLAFSPDGETIATGAFEVKLWNTATGECLKTAKLVENQFVFSLSFSPDGRTLAAHQQGQGVKLWNLENGTTELLAIPSIGGGRAVLFG